MVQQPETKGAKWKSAIFNFIIYNYNCHVTRHGLQRERPVRAESQDTKKQESYKCVTFHFIIVKMYLLLKPGTCFKQNIIIFVFNFSCFKELL